MRLTETVKPQEEKEEKFAPSTKRPPMKNARNRRYFRDMVNFRKNAVSMQLGENTAKSLVFMNYRMEQVLKNVELATAKLMKKARLDKDVMADKNEG